MEDLQITHEDNQLVIRGRQGEDGQNRVFLYRGIASRQFQRAFVLAEGIEIKGAWLNNGLLHIDLIRPQPETRVRTIPIDTVAEVVIGSGARAGKAGSARGRRGADGYRAAGRDRPDRGRAVTVLHNQPSNGAGQ